MADCELQRTLFVWRVNPIPMQLLHDSTMAKGGPDLASFPGLRGGGKGLVRTVCACALISRHSGNSVLRTDNSVFKRHYRILSGLSLGSLREREYNQYTSAEKRSHSLSSVFNTYLWNTGKSTLSRVFSPEPRLDGSLPDLTEGFYRFYSDCAGRQLG